MAENENKQENVVVEDFKRTNAKKSKKKFRHRQQNPVLAFYEDNKQYLLLFGVIVVALAAILVSILALKLSLIHISEPTRRVVISYAVFCLKKKKT